MDVTVLGCDGSYPGPGGASSGYLVREADFALWIDAGPGSLANLQRHLDLADVDAVVVTHEHVDHWSDLEHFAVAAHYVVPRPPVPLYSCVDLRTLMRTPATAALVWHPLSAGDKLPLGPLDLRFSRTDHSVETLAVRVEAGGRAFGYSADSGPGWELSELGTGLNLAFCEATYLSDREGNLPHMSARQAGETARRAGVERLVITHLWPGTDRQAALEEAGAAFGRPVELARAGARYEV
jgi:ribonuclease BN (tRNA processing enzyme)